MACEQDEWLEPCAEQISLTGTFASSTIRPKLVPPPSVLDTIAASAALPGQGTHSHPAYAALRAFRTLYSNEVNGEVK